MEFRQLRYFLAVARGGGISAAARQLRIAQPALTRQLHALERELEAELFVRGPKGVSLTPAGELFLADAERLLGDLETAQRRVRRLVRGQQGSLRIGIAPNYTWHPAILGILQNFRAAYPDVSVMLEPELSARQLDAIEAGRLDGGFLGWRPKDNPALDGVTVMSNRLLLAVPATSPYAARPPRRLKELRDESFIWFPRERSPAYYDFLIHQCHSAGFTPKLVLIATDVSTILGLVAAGMGYSLVSEASKYNCPAQAILHAHPELGTAYEVEFVWRKDNPVPALRSFLGSVR